MDVGEKDRSTFESVAQNIHSASRYIWPCFSVCAVSDKSLSRTSRIPMIKDCVYHVKNMQGESQGCHHWSVLVKDSADSLVTLRPPYLMMPPNNLTTCNLTTSSAHS